MNFNGGQSMGNSIFEVVETDESLPFDVSLHSVNYVPSHWHNSIEMIFVLRGNLEVTIDSRKHSLHEGSVLLINQCHVHEVIGLDMNIIATFLIPVSYLKEHMKGIESIQFDVDSGTVLKEKRPALDRIRQFMAEMVQLKHKKSEAYELDMQIRLLGIFSILMKQFKVSAPSGGINEKYMDRMLRIITYIDEHYQEAVSLQAIAEREYLSLPYLSKFFSENIGMNFQTYLTSIRLKNAVEDLLHNDDTSIADLAMTHGFPNAKSFYTAFKNRYHMTPNEYRKQYRPEWGEKHEKQSSNYMTFNQSSALGIIQQYLQRGQDYPSNVMPEVHTLETVSYPVDGSVKGTPIQHTWKNLITIGKAQEGLHADVQAHLRYVQEKVGFRYLRFHGIFDDGMMVYKEDEAGQPLYNFRFVDQLFDFLLSIGLKPFVELGFMPSELAADRTKTVFYRASYVSPPKSLDRWCELVDRFIRHCMNRYGAEEVSSWKLEFWNEPELQMFWPASVTEYLEMYRRTYETVKNISVHLPLGAPGRVISIRSMEFTQQFFDYCRDHACMPDFIPLHFYPHEEIEDLMDMKQIDPLYQLQPFRQLLEEFMGISPNPNFLMDMLIQEQQILAEHGAGELEVYLTEWNSTSYHRELTNDTLYKAAYITKNIIDNLDRIRGFGYWVLSDNIEETAASTHLFHGGLGLIAQYSIPKAAMYAYELLAKLGDRVVAQGENYIVTAGRGGYQILTYNYCHFDDLYALGDTSFIHLTNRYNGFKEVKDIRIEFELNHFPQGTYRMKRYTMSRTHGSSYDTWVKIGAPTDITPDDIEYLKSYSRPAMRMEYVEMEEGKRIVTHLEPHGVELLELYPVY